MQCLNFKIMKVNCDELTTAILSRGIPRTRVLTHSTTISATCLMSKHIDEMYNISGPMEIIYDMIHDPSCGFTPSTWTSWEWRGWSSPACAASPERDKAQERVVAAGSGRERSWKNVNSISSYQPSSSPPSQYKYESCLELYCIDFFLFVSAIKTDHYTNERKRSTIIFPQEEIFNILIP